MTTSVQAETFMVQDSKVTVTNENSKGVVARIQLDNKPDYTDINVGAILSFDIEKFGPMYFTVDQTVNTECSKPCPDILRIVEYPPGLIAVPSDSVQVEEDGSGVIFLMEAESIPMS